MRNSSLWSIEVFEKEVISQQNSWITFETSRVRSRNQASESTQVCGTGVFFLSLFSPNFNDQLSSNFHRFVYLCMLRYTKWEDWSLTIFYQKCPSSATKGFDTGFQDKKGHLLNLVWKHTDFEETCLTNIWEVLHSYTYPYN